MPVAQFSGLASGIDSAALIDSIIKARNQTNEVRRAEIEHLGSENDSLDELDGKILTLNDLIDEFRTANGGGVSKKATSGDSSTVTAIAGSNAVNSSFAINTITSVAKTGNGSFNQSYAASTTVASTAGSGTVSIDVGTGANLVNISATVTQNVTTIAELVDALNADTDAAGRFSASLINVGTSSSPSYKIAFNSLQQGTDLGTLAATITPAITELQAPTLSQATDAVFTMSGVTGNITRSTNTIDDLITGVTLQLNKTSGSAVNISISDDATATSDKIEEIVAAYNDIVEYINENDTIQSQNSGSGTVNIYGSLAKTRLDNDFLSAFRLEISGATSANGTAVTAMSEMGISTNRDGTLSFDSETFAEAVSSDSLGVQEVLNDFADSASGTGGMLYQYTSFGGFIDIAQEANNSQITNLNDKIDQVERQSDKVRESLTAQFSRLEVVTGRLQSTQNALSGILAGL